MLEVFSPIPMQEGESLVFGISTKHVMHFAIGVGLSTPIVGVAMVLSPYLGFPKLGSLVISAGMGLLFVMLPVKNRPLAEWLWISFRLFMRPKVVLFDREYRVRVHRKEASK